MFTTCGGSFQGIRLCPKLLKSYTINTYSLLSVSYTILKWLWKSADSWVPAWSVEASCGGCSEERKGVRVQAFPDSPEQSGDDHPRGPTAAASTVTSTGLQSTHRNYVSTSSIIPPGKVCRCHYFCFDIWNPFKSSRTSLENYWEVNSSRRQPVAQCLHRVVMAWEFSCGSGWTDPGVSDPWTMSSKRIPSHLRDPSPPNSSLENI